MGKTGKLHLFYEPPAAAQRDKITKLVKDKFAASGLTIETAVKKDAGAPLLWLTCGLS